MTMVVNGLRLAAGVYQRRLWRQDRMNHTDKRLRDIPSGDLKRELSRRAQAVQLLAEVGEVVYCGRLEVQYLKGRIKFVRLFAEDLIEDGGHTA